MNPPSLSFRQFFRTKLDGEQQELLNTYVGRSKDQTDQVDSDLNVSEVCSAFGHFVKFYCQHVGTLEASESMTVDAGKLVGGH